MARFYGMIGFAKTADTRPGIFTEEYEEFPYKGYVTSRKRDWDSSDYLNDNLEIANDISIIADSFANSNFGAMRYVRWKKQTFKITSASVDTERHRITLSIGGVFNPNESIEEVSRAYPE